MTERAIRTVKITLSGPAGELDALSVRSSEEYPTDAIHQVMFDLMDRNSLAIGNTITITEVAP